jgi:hypothetical protein
MVTKRLNAHLIRSLSDQKACLLQCIFLLQDAKFMQAICDNSNSEEGTAHLTHALGIAWIGHMLHCFIFGGIINDNCITISRISPEGIPPRRC